MSKSNSQEQGKAHQALLEELETLKLEVDSLRSEAERSNRTERLLREALDTFPDQVILYDKHERVVFTNERYHEFYPHSPPKDKIVGYSQEELLRRTLVHGQVAHPLAKSDPEAWLAMRLAERRNKAKSDGFMGETTHTSGRSYMYRHRHTSEGGMILVQTDITERKRAEEDLRQANAEMETRVKERTQAFQRSEAMFRAVYENSSVGISLIDFNDNLLKPNRAQCAIIGFDQSDFPGTSYKAYIHPDEQSGYRRFLKKMKAGKIDSYEQIQRYIRKDESIFWVRSNVARLPPGIDNDAFAITINEDITDLIESKEHLQEALQDAERANQAKSEFLASMSHELRTPLNAVLGFAQMMKFDPGNPLSDAQNDHVENILTGGSHLLELVNEILDLARIEADHITLDLEDVNAQEAVASCIALALPLGAKRGIQFIDRISGTSSGPVRTDLMRLKQATINLLSNAVKYNKDGGTIIIDGWETDDRFFHISIKDTGVGIAKADHHGVFKMFHRLGADPMKSREGTGIGLTVTKLLIERMAGRVGFESEEGVGSTFWFELPLTINGKALIWTDDLNIGIDAIDRDHQVIVGLLNKVTHRIINETELVEILEQLINYTHYHFRREEAVMKACNYPDLIPHRKIHKKLLAKVNDLASQWHHDHDQETLRELRKFLRRWLFNHILKVDAEITPYSQGKGLEIRKALENIR